MLRILITGFSLVVVPLVTPAIGHAEERACEATEESTLDRLRAAYGGTKLEELASVWIESDRRIAWPGQGQTASFVEFATERVATYLDFRSGLGSHESWVAQNGNVYHQRVILDDEKTTSIDYGQMSFREAPQEELTATFGSSFRGSDLLLAYWLQSAERAQLRHAGEYYAGQENDVITFRMTAEGPILSAYVSCTTGFIHRVRMEREFGDVNLIFARPSTDVGHSSRHRDTWLYRWSAD